MIANQLLFTHIQIIDIQTVVLNKFICLDDLKKQKK